MAAELALKRPISQRKGHDGNGRAEPALEPFSIVRWLSQQEVFSDRFASGREGAVDVLIPVMHTNEMWGRNLISIYREIPVNRLLLGDGGCIDQTIEIAKKFPRLVVDDHRGFTSLGYSIRKLIERVETEWFVY